MPNPLEVESTLTERYQTTVPDTVRRALRLKKHDRIRYAIHPGGEVVLTRAPEAGDSTDPVLGKFLDFIARDIAAHPEHVQAMDAGTARRLKKLVAGVKADLDAPLRDEDE